MKQILNILAVVLVGSVSAMALCYDKAVPDDSDQNVTYDSSCTDQACQAGTAGGCSGTKREQVQKCDTDTSATGKVCSLGSKTVKLTTFTGNCGNNNAGVCDCLNKTDVGNPTDKNINTCQCVTCGGG